MNALAYQRPTSYLGELPAAEAEKKQTLIIGGIGLAVIAAGLLYVRSEVIALDRKIDASRASRARMRQSSGLSGTPPKRKPKKHRRAASGK